MVKNTQSLEKEIKHLRAIVYQQSSQIAELTSLIKSVLVAQTDPVLNVIKESVITEELAIAKKPLKGTTTLARQGKDSSKLKSTATKDRSRFYYKLRKTKVKNQVSIPIEVADDVVVKKDGASLLKASQVASTSKPEMLLEASCVKVVNSAKDIDLLILNNRSIVKNSSINREFNLCNVCKSRCTHTRECSAGYCLHHCKGFPHNKGNGCWKKS